MTRKALSVEEIFKILETLPRDAKHRVRIHFQINYPNYKRIWTTEEVFYDDEDWFSLPSDEYFGGGEIWGFRNGLFYFCFTRTGEKVELNIFEITRDEKLKQMLYSLKSDLKIDMSNDGQPPDVRKFKVGEVVLEIYELVAIGCKSDQSSPL